MRNDFSGIHSRPAQRASLRYARSAPSETTLLVLSALLDSETAVWVKMLMAKESV